MKIAAENTLAFILILPFLIFGVIFLGTFLLITEMIPDVLRRFFE